MEAIAFILYWNRETLHEEAAVTHLDLPFSFIPSWHRGFFLRFLRWLRGDGFLTVNVLEVIARSSESKHRARSKNALPSASSGSCLVTTTLRFLA